MKRELDKFLPGVSYSSYESLSRHGIRHIMEIKDPYSKAHLVVSAIRVLEHRQSAPPSIEEVCRMIEYTLEQGHMICRKLKELGIIDIVEGTYGTRLSVKNHLAIEEIPRGIQESHLDKELKAFQTTRKDGTKEREIESFKAKQEEKKKALFAEIEKKLKDNLEQKPSLPPSNK
jgi:hypothetical protein